MLISEGLNRALEFLNKGNSRQAEQICKQILQSHPANPDAFHVLGLIADQTGRADEALKHLARAIELRPGDAAFHANRGNVYLRLGQLDDAARCYEQGLRLQPDSPEMLSNLCNALRRLGRVEEAIAFGQRAVRVAPGSPAAHNSLGNAFKATSRADEAVVCFREVLRLQPQSAIAWNNLGTALAAQGRQDEALDCYRAALKLQPTLASAYQNVHTTLTARANHLTNLGRLAEARTCQDELRQMNFEVARGFCTLGSEQATQGRTDEAEASFRAALKLEPNLIDAHNRLGHVLQIKNRFEEAAECYERVLALHPTQASAFHNLGNVLLRQGMLDSAIQLLERALQLEARDPQIYLSLGVAWAGQGDLKKAIAFYDRAVALDPNFGMAHLGLSIAWLALGDFKKGWAEYEWRWKTTECPPRTFSQPRWDGTSLEGKTILLHAEQGLGDTLNFIRYVPLVKQRGGRVIVECQERLLRLLANFPGIDQLVPQAATLPDFDVQVTLPCLPGVLGTTLETIPADVPYLHAEDTLLQKWCEELGETDTFKVGIAWRGNPDHKADRDRSIALKQYAPLADIAGVRLYSLQVGPGSEQVKEQAKRFAIVDLSEKFASDFAETAAFVKNLDMVITADSAPAHLAGALGMPVWVAIPFAPDWRWLVGREDSPWYPTLRLFRQNARGDWEGVFARMAEALKATITMKQAGSVSDGQP